MNQVNPFEPPKPVDEELVSSSPTLIPRSLAMHTRKVVSRFGMYQLLWTIAAVFWTGSLIIDVLALFISVNGHMMKLSSFKRFPWTALFCCAYPLTFVVSVSECDPSDIVNWLLARDSPVLSLQLVSTLWALYAIRCIVRCHLSHRRVPSGEDA